MASNPPPSGQASTVSRAWSVPYARNIHFTGREDELRDLRGSLTSDQPGRRVQVICGLGGIGKTQLALEYLYRNKEQYNIVWWINADEPATLALGFARLGTQLGMHIPEGTGLDDIRHAVRRVLDTRSDWLLIFDNAAGVDDIRNYIPIERKGHVLITSRNPNWEAIARPFPLKPMKRVDSVQFLLHRTGINKPDTAVGMLAQALGDLPLAMEQAAACIERTRMDFGGYLKRFETHWAELLAETKQTGDYPDSVEMTWEISFRQLQEEAPEAAALLNLLAFLGPDAIPRSMLRDGAAMLPDELATVAANDHLLDTALASLRTYSLIEDDGRLIGVHRLVGTLVRDRLGDGERATWAEAAIKMLAISFKFDSIDLLSWDRAAEQLPHALAASWHAEANNVAPRATVTVLDDAGRYLIKRAQYAEAKGLFERAMAIATTFYGESHPQVSAIANNLGRVHRLLGNVDEAKEHFQRSMQIDQATYGESDPRMAAVFNNYGVILQESGDAEGARQQFEWALEMYKQHYGEDHPKVAAIINNLGYMKGASGDLAGGMQQFQEALGIAVAQLGEDHPTVGAIRVNLGMLQRLSGDLQGAKANLERGLESLEASAGSMHPSVARACGHLGATLQQMGMLGAARVHFERALQVDEAFYGPTHTNIAGRAMQLANVLRVMNDVEAAQELSNRAARILSSASELKPAGSAG
jgi:tetratricopeptide (TPR) repeat protein